MSKNLTIRQQLLLAAADRHFEVSSELVELSRAVNAAIDSEAVTAYLHSVPFHAHIAIAANVDEALEARRDICAYCKGDTTDARIGFNCCHCGGN